VEEKTNLQVVNRKTVSNSNLVLIFLSQLFWREG